MPIWVHFEDIDYNSVISDMGDRSCSTDKKMCFLYILFNDKLQLELTQW